MKDLHVGIITGKVMKNTLKYFFSIFFQILKIICSLTLFCLVSDRCFAGETEDKSGQALRDLVSKNFGATITSALVPDEIDKIEVKR